MGEPTPVDLWGLCFVAAVQITEIFVSTVSPLISLFSETILVLGPPPHTPGEKRGHSEPALQPPWPVATPRKQGQGGPPQRRSGQDPSGPDGFGVVVGKRVCSRIRLLPSPALPLTAPAAGPSGPRALGEAEMQGHLQDTFGLTWPKD